MKYVNALAFVAALAGAVACGSSDGDDTDGADGAGGSGTGGDGAGTGGSTPGAGGSNPGAGGSNPGAGGSDPGTGGGSNPDAIIAECPEDTYVPLATAPEDCSASPAPEVPQISDFETNADGWGLYRDAFPVDELGTTSPEFTEAVVTSDGGPEGSTKAIIYSGTGFTSGVRLNVGYGGQCRDVKALEGLSFWAKGTVAAETAGWGKPANALTVLLGDAGDDALPDYQIALTETWKEYRIPFDCFGAGGETPNKIGGYLTNIEFHVRGGTFNFEIDQVAYY